MRLYKTKIGLLDKDCKNNILKEKECQEGKIMENKALDRENLNISIQRKI